MMHRRRSEYKNFSCRFHSRAPFAAHATIVTIHSNEFNFSA
jgi:hypothetical protein